LMDKMRRVKWFFAHASVGSNMLDGLADLHRSNPDQFSMGFVKADAAALPSTRPGTMYECNRGNPGWKAKLDGFEELVAQGWRRPAVDVAMNKLCYIDQRASLKYYVNSMARLEEQAGGTVLVYA